MKDKLSNINSKTLLSKNIFDEFKILELKYNYPL